MKLHRFSCSSRSRPAKPYAGQRICRMHMYCHVKQRVINERQQVRCNVMVVIHAPMLHEDPSLSCPTDLHLQRCVHVNTYVLCIYSVTTQWSRCRGEGALQCRGSPCYMKPDRFSCSNRCKSTQSCMGSRCIRSLTTTRSTRLSDLLE